MRLAFSPNHMQQMVCGKMLDATGWLSAAAPADG
jgi:hypothetical protein